MTTLIEMAEKIEKATGPDRKLDLEITRALLPTDFAHQRNQAGLIKDPDWIGSEKFTASLDAAVSLCERVLPDAQWQVTRLTAPTDCYEAWVGLPGTDGERFSSAKLPHLALVAVTLRALALRALDSQRHG